jgi:hypothetical protein
MQDSVPRRRRRSKQDGTAATTEEVEFDAQFARECAFVSCCQLIHHPASGGETELRRTY